LANLYQKQGLKIQGKDGRNEIIGKVAEVLGLSEGGLKQSLKSFLTSRIGARAYLAEQH